MPGKPLPGNLRLPAGVTDTPITVRLPPEILTQLRAVAKELDRPLSWVIRQALERWLKERES